PHEFSGGQRQRIAIARALILKPKLLIADEPVSALDASIQAQIINLLKDLRKQKGLTILFISHDLNVIRYLADRVGIMYFGKLIEENEIVSIFNFPKQDYTKKLLSSSPKLII
ncbi:ABC transporter ATP-binding protein, partial [bacterium]|nr:ABC transporter ATP-binding protein [bacterium]